MNWHKILGYIIPLGTAIIELPKLTWQGVLVTLVTTIGTLIVRPSQVSNATGTVAGKMPGNKADRQAAEDVRNEP